MRFVFAAIALACIAACAPSEQSGALVAGCDLRAAAQWRAGNADYAVEAFTSGPDCQRAVATFVVRDSSGVPLYAESHLAEHIMMLAPAHDAAAMQNALQEWVSYDNHTMATSSALPDWPGNADGPRNGEFPFYPDEGFDRERYMTLRGRDLPLLCYVQGMESLACLALENGAFEKVGVQAFPG